MSKAQTTYPRTSNLTLEQMETRVNSDEALFLRLTDLGHTEEETLLTFDRSTSAPPHKISLRKEDDQPAGETICTGTIWIVGKEQSVTAYRRSS